MISLKTIGAVLLCAAGALVSTSSMAGYKYALEVYVTGTTAQGALGAARASADSMQYIGCVVADYSSGSSTGYCYARNRVGTSLYCQTTNAAQINSIRAINGQSQVYFTVPSWSSTCSQINLYQVSYNLPSTP
jgi:hypothetical protein